MDHLVSYTLTLQVTQKPLRPLSKLSCEYELIRKACHQHL